MSPSVLHHLKSRDSASSTGARSSDNESTSEEDDLQIQSLLMRNRGQLEQMEALRVRSHLLRAEDYVSPLITVLRGILRYIADMLLEGDKWTAGVLFRPFLVVIGFLSVVNLAKRLWEGR